MHRQQAFELLCEYTRNENLRRHMLAVEAAMRAYARKFGEDEEKWGLVGLLHDFDYERWPNPPDHPLQGAAILAERGYPEDVIYAIKSHADYLGDCPRRSRMDKTLYACDELSGLISACALVRPEGLSGLQAQSVRKKMKQKSFAAAVNREDIVRGAGRPRRGSQRPHPVCDRCAGTAWRGPGAGPAALTHVTSDIGRSSHDGLAIRSSSSIWRGYVALSSRRRVCRCSSSGAEPSVNFFRRMWW